MTCSQEPGRTPCVSGWCSFFCSEAAVVAGASCSKRGWACIGSRVQRRQYESVSTVTLQLHMPKDRRGAVSKITNRLHRVVSVLPNLESSSSY